VTQYTLPPEDLFPTSIAMGPQAGPDAVWFTVAKGQPGRTAGEQHLEPAIGRISFGGEIREFPLPSSGPNSVMPYAITAGNDGAMWYLAGGRVGRITAGGQVTEFPIDTGTSSEGEIVSGSDGNLWFTKRNDGGRDAIVRLTLAGQATEFPLPHRESGPGGIAAGPDGSLWFTESFGRRIGRITTSGEIAEFPVSAQPTDIVAGHDGNLWFSTSEAIGRISTAGRVFRPVTVEGGFGPLVAGPDLRLWFAAAGGGALGRITPDGRRSRLMLPTAEATVVDLVAVYGTVWYLAAGERPCEGGGGTCMATPFVKPGLIGRIEPGRPVVVIKAAGFSIHRRWARVRLACLGGEALGRCRGELTLETKAGVLFGHKRFEVRTDAAGTVPVRLTRDGREAVLAGGRLRVYARVDFPEGNPTSRRFVVPARSGR
jgi:streptogramin lyase